jgi:hypothetical protein
MKILALIFFAFYLSIAPGLAQDLEPEISHVYTTYYPAQEIGLIHYPGYDLKTSQLVWLPNKTKPSLIFGYHKAVPFYDRDVTLHFSLVIRHTQASQVVKDNYRCQSDYQQLVYRHPQFGDYLVCTKKLSSAAFPGAKNQAPMEHMIASVFPKKGNKLPHVSINLHGFEKDILPLLESLSVLH